MLVYNRIVLLNFFNTILLSSVRKCISDQPPYQVSLFVNLDSSNNLMHVCNGAIIQSRLILTTATCVHHHMPLGGTFIPIQPSKITVMAGSTNEFQNAISSSVTNIEIFDDYNHDTMDNDLAILHLANTLPLGLRNDIQWIIIDDGFDGSPSLTSFNDRTSFESDFHYTLTEELPILRTKECTDSSLHLDARNNDICSYYILPAGLKCQDIDTFIAFNNDRGTGLVSNSHLVALMSAIVPEDFTKYNSNCSEVRVKAFYTNIGRYMDWIYLIIADEEYTDLPQTNYTASSPYQQIVGELIANSENTNADSFVVEDRTEGSTIYLVPDVSEITSTSKVLQIPLPNSQSSSVKHFIICLLTCLLIIVCTHYV